MTNSDSKWITHADLEAEFQSLQLPEGWALEAEPKKAEIFFTRFREWREDVFRRHLRTLSHNEQTSIAAGEHPSQSHERGEAARAWADQLMEELRLQGVNFIVEVRVSLYHGNRIVLSMIVETGTDDDLARTSLPCYFHGFETKWRPQKNQSEQVAVADRHQHHNFTPTTLQSPGG